MNSIASDEEIGTAIADRLAEQDRSQSWLARKTGIPLSTLRRRLLYPHAPFTVEELRRISAAVGLPVEELIRPKAA